MTAFLNQAGLIVNIQYATPLWMTMRTVCRI